MLIDVYLSFPLIPHGIKEAIKITISTLISIHKYGELFIFKIIFPQINPIFIFG